MANKVNISHIIVVLLSICLYAVGMYAVFAVNDLGFSLYWQVVIAIYSLAIILPATLLTLIKLGDTTFLRLEKRLNHWFTVAVWSSSVVCLLALI